MADKKFGVKQIDLIGASGTPNLTSPNNLNINAVTVAISTDVTIGGQVTSNIIVGTGKSIGIGTTIPLSSLDVRGVVAANEYDINGSSNTLTTGGLSVNNINASGVSTFAGITTVSGATLFANQLNVSGVSTFSNNVRVSGIVTANSVLVSNDGGKNGSVLIEDTGAYSQITFRSSTGTDQTQIQGIEGNLYLTPGSGGYVGLSDSTTNLFYRNGNVILNNGANGTTTLSNGLGVVGLTTTTSLSVSGVSTLTGNAFVGSAITMYASTGIISATTFYGNVVGNITGSITDATNLTGGYANASQLNVSGVTTIAAGRIQANADANLRFGNLAAGSGSSRNIAIGDQVLSSLSGGTGRNIGIGELSYYDTTTGSYNIGLGIQAGQKITTGSYNVIIGGYNGQTGLDLRTSSNNIVIADGQGNIRQYINSSGNVGIKTTLASEALTVSGVVSATSFYGILNAGQLTGVLPVLDGSNLFGVTAVGSGIQVRDDGSIVGTAATIDFGSNLSVTFGAGIATVSGASSVSAATTAYALAGTPNLNVGIVTAARLVSSGASLTSPLIVGLTTATYGIRFAADPGASQYVHNIGPSYIIGYDTAAGYENDAYLQFSQNNSNYILKNVGIGTTNPTSKLTVSGDGKFTGVVTATTFSGSGANLTSLPAAQLTGTLPAIDGSALLNVNATGTGIVVLDDGVNIGSAKTVNFGTGLDVTYSASGIATVTASGGSLQSRTIVNGITTSIANNGIGNTDITGFKSYALMKVGLSTAGWLRLYTDSASRTADASRSQGIDPTPGSGVIAEVITTGLSTSQIITPFVMGGNLNNPADTTIYAAITNLSGVTSSISVNLTILQLEA